jgi:hypothetical protein
MIDFNKVGGRKLIAFVITLASGIAVHVLSTKGVTSELRDILLGALGIFVTGNSWVTAKTAGAQATEASAADPVSVADHTDQLTRIELGQQGLLNAVEQVGQVSANTATMLATALKPRA